MNLRERMRGMRWLAVIFALLVIAGFWGPYSCGGDTTVFQRDGSLMDSMDSYTSIMPANDEVTMEDTSSIVALSDYSSPIVTSLTEVLPSFYRYAKKRHADYLESVHYTFCVDFPKKAIKNDNIIRQWLVEKIIGSFSNRVDIPVYNAIYIGYSKKEYDDLRYKGDVYDDKQIEQGVSSLYFAIKKGEYGTNEEDYPSVLYSELNLQARLYNQRYVTYQMLTDEYNGGAHGYYTEKLISYDHVHHQEINIDYLFKPNCMDKILGILLDEARKTPNYIEWNPNIADAAIVKGEDEKPTGEIDLPQPGLSENGMVFSYQPYEISCFAAGTFHFTIPYERLVPYLTERAKWCLKIN